METKVLILPAYTLNNCLSTANVENYSLKNNPEVTKIVKATYSSVKKKMLSLERDSYVPPP